MSITEIAATDVVTVSRDDDVASVVAEMANNDVGMVVVVEDNKPVGIVTDRKIALSVQETEDVANQQVSSLMTEDPITVAEDSNVFETITKLSDAAIRRAPVVDDQNQLTGVISVDDIIVLLAAELGNVSDIIEAQSPRF